MPLTGREPEDVPANTEKVPLSNARQQEVGGMRIDVKRRGRPRCRVDGQQVRDLRGQKKSWRQIARVLHIGTATAMRAYNASPGAPEASQNS